MVLVRTRIVAPSRSLAQRNRALADGSGDTGIGFQPNDEIGDLTDAFNDSAQRIGALISRLENEHQNLAQAESLF